MFAVSQDFEEQHLVKCPVCKTDKALQDVSAGELHIQQKQQLLIVPEEQTNIYEFMG
ncbi:hypothetical protein [Anoxybacillus ayderensis]|uniref:hypothetical protein n=1 Tax=Anoxybacillus ayderensis TaxID=265546 RepID=UPI001CB8EE6F|nr:hypothetical protein [Anoxybacillus ayderensis]MCX8047314.1 hypothetical protein [Anoxybacillus gonensis]